MGREARTALQSIDGEYRSPQRHLPLVVACCLCRCEPVGALHCFEDTGRDPGGVSAFRRATAPRQAAHPSQEHGLTAADEEMAWSG